MRNPQRKYSAFSGQHSAYSLLLIVCAFPQPPGVHRLAALTPSGCGKGLSPSRCRTCTAQQKIPRRHRRASQDNFNCRSWLSFNVNIYNIHILTTCFRPYQLISWQQILQLPKRLEPAVQAKEEGKPFVAGPVHSDCRRSRWLKRSGQRWKLTSPDQKSSRDVSKGLRSGRWSHCSDSSFAMRPKYRCLECRSSLSFVSSTLLSFAKLKRRYRWLLGLEAYSQNQAPQPRCCLGSSCWLSCWCWEWCSCRKCQSPKSWCFPQSNWGE